VQALAGVLLPSASVFLLLLCNDRAVLGPWVNPPWLNALAAVIISALLMLSAILTITTLFPGIDVPRLLQVLSAVLVVGWLIAGTWALRSRRGSARAVPVSREERAAWTMPPLALLDRPRPSALRNAGLWAMRGYLVVAVVLLIVKSLQLATGHA
jgi:hypothetical protein